MIEIIGLNRRQQALADIMWAMDGREQVDSFIRALHPKDRAEAQTVCELMILAFIDEVTEVEDSVKSMIDNCRY
jgi:hypothetical protein